MWIDKTLVTTTDPVFIFKHNNIMIICMCDIKRVVSFLGILKIFG